MKRDKRWWSLRDSPCSKHKANPDIPWKQTGWSQHSSTSLYLRFIYRFNYIKATWATQTHNWFEAFKLKNGILQRHNYCFREHFKQLSFLCGNTANTLIQSDWSNIYLTDFRNLIANDLLVFHLGTKVFHIKGWLPKKTISLHFKSELFCFLGLTDLFCMQVFNVLCIKYLQYKVSQ